MKKLTLLIIFLSSSIFAVEYKCHDQALNSVVEYLEYENTDVFYSELDEIFFCKSKKTPHREIFQWGDGSGLVGIDYIFEDGNCVSQSTPHVGQDDHDLDWEWAFHTVKIST